MPVIGAPLDAVGYDDAPLLTDTLDSPLVTLYLIHYPLWAYQGYAWIHGYAAVRYTGSRIVTEIAHEVSHVLGASDYYAWSQDRGWHCTAEPDLMCTGALTPFGWQSLKEIFDFTVPMAQSKEDGWNQSGDSAIAG